MKLSLFWDIVTRRITGATRIAATLLLAFCGLVTTACVTTTTSNPLSAEEQKLVGTWTLQQGPAATVVQYQENRRARSTAIYQGRTYTGTSRWQLVNGQLAYSSGIIYRLNFIDNGQVQVTLVDGNGRLPRSLGGTHRMYKYSQSPSASPQGALAYLETKRPSRSGGGMSESEALAAMALLIGLMGAMDGPSDSYDQREIDRNNAIISAQSQQMGTNSW